MICLKPRITLLFETRGREKGSKQDVSISCKKFFSPWELTARWTLLNFKQSIEKKWKLHTLHDIIPNSKYPMMAPFRQKTRPFQRTCPCFLHITIKMKMKFNEEGIIWQLG